MVEWKDITGYEGLYKISNCGDVWSCNKQVVLKNNDNGNGYYRVSLYKNGTTKSMYVHRLVALNFIPKADGKNIVNHIDENTTNNNVNNLEWCNHKENYLHGNTSKKSVESRNNSDAWKRSVDKKGVAVIGVNIETNQILKYKSVAEAGRNGFVRERISLCINGKLDKHRGYKWSKAN
ncbi:NUMOD4 domain-containing protein [Staphylococcus arlettae]|uniref:NUMOD4 domain-containing protein n=1 Tax=Staphylococcus arlettae TaxID=29378 RepID=UPI0034DD59C8